MPASLFLALEKFPESSDTHLWADYVELRCLTDPDLMITKSDIQAYVQKRKDLQKGLSDYSDADDAEPENEDIKSAADIKRAARAEDLFKHLEYRAAAFDDFYPFTLSRDGDILRRRNRLRAKHKLYIFFLLSSNLGHINNRQYRNIFTNTFELASVTALKLYLPVGAQVYLFGKNPLNKGPYSGQLLKKIKLLAENLGEKFVGKESEFPSNDFGDNGLDLVGWIPLGDNARGVLLVFGQCSCSDEEWPAKQYLSSSALWGKTIDFIARPSNMIFIPFCYRNNTGGWHLERMIDDAVLMDRLRLLKLLRKNYFSLKELPNSLIKKALAQRNSFVA
jgi:hypothetical protein